MIKESLTTNCNAARAPIALVPVDVLLERARGREGNRLAVGSPRRVEHCIHTVNGIDKTSVITVVDAHAETNAILNDGATESAPHFIAGCTAFRVGNLSPIVSLVSLHARLGLDEAHGAALGSGTEQGSLRTAQDFDALDIKH